jgi:hypothetical protein
MTTYYLSADSNDGPVGFSLENSDRLSLTFGPRFLTIWSYQAKRLFPSFHFALYLNGDTSSRS